MPQYAVEAAFARDLDPNLFFSGRIKVSDFGDAFFEDQPPQQTSDIGPYMVPEFTSPSRMSCKMDVWLLGCAIYQVLSGHDLFGVPDDPSWMVGEKIMQALGKPPDELLGDWEGFVGRKIEVVETPTKPLKERVRELREGSIERGMKDRRDEISEKDAKQLTELLETLLVYDPEKRPSIDEVFSLPTMDYFRQ